MYDIVGRIWALEAERGLGLNPALPLTCTLESDLNPSELLYPSVK